MSLKHYTNNMNDLKISLLFAIIAFVTGDVIDKCTNSLAQTCEECMQVDPDCVWISQYPLSSNKERCTVQSNVTDGDDFIHGNRTKVKILEDREYMLPLDDRESDQPAVQIRPQRVKVWLRQGESANFTIRYKALDNYPLDIYYLVDQTFSMKNHLSELSSLGDTLAAELESLTTNFRIAFGYFSDKVEMPYYAMASNRKQNPCLGIVDNLRCVPGSNFVHALNFTNNTLQFHNNVRRENFNFTANLDDPEGGLDALFQILLCDALIGWRKHSRKMIVLATDGLLHTAGDGVLGGFVKRAPNRCELELKNDKYVYGGIGKDYPSLEELYRLLLNKKAAVLFAIQQRDGTGRFYESLNALLHEVSFLEMMGSGTSQNITAALEAGFRDAVKKVQFSVGDAPSYLQFESTTDCVKHEDNSWGCGKVEFGKEYVFNISVKLIGPPTDSVSHIRIEEKHLHEFIDVEIEYAERCKCTDMQIREPNSHIIFSCGVFICDSQWVGKQCEQKCDPHKARYTSSCKKQCCGRGDFDINSCKCKCDFGTAGEHCEYQCEITTAKVKKEVCSGHGSCGVGGCNCDKQWEGPNCNCSKLTDMCRLPGSDAICSNHGICECNRCKCKKIERESNPIIYKGAYCEFCSGCQTCKYDYIVLNHIRELPQQEGSEFSIRSISDLKHEYECKIFYSPNSTHSCKVSYTSSINGTIRIAYHQDCNYDVFEAGLFVSKAYPVLVGVVLFLLLPLLAWKVYATIIDRREYAQFKKNEERACFQNNDLYHSPITTYSNPMKKQSNSNNS